MGKLNIFEIILTKSAYASGETLQGNVTVELNDEMKMRGVRLHFHGEAYVYWTEEHTYGSGDDETTTTDVYSSKEKYFNFPAVLYGKGIRLRFHGQANVHWSEQHSTGSGKNQRTTTTHYSSAESYIDFTVVLYGKGIRIQFHGQADVHWSERHSTGSGKNRRTTTRHYRSSETYFNFTVVLFGKAEGQSGPDPVLPAGRYVYPFTYQLPNNLPSSFEGGIGRVRYWLSAVIDRPWKFDHKSKCPFSVLSILDLNAQPSVRDSQSGSGSKTLCCLCCESGPITANFRTDRKGYVPGEVIVLDGEVENKSNRTMSHTRVELRMYTTFKATTKSRTNTQVVVKLERGELEEGQTEVWSGERLQIPPLPPSDLVFCNIIDIVYHIVMVVDPSGPAFDLDVPLEILIGTVPLQNIQSYFSAGSYAPPQYNPNWATGGQPPPITAPPAPFQPPVNSSMPPPPSYSEYALGKSNVQDEEGDEYTRGAKEWAPVYTYYSWDQPAQPSAPPM